MENLKELNMLGTSILEDFLGIPKYLPRSFISLNPRLQLRACA